MKRGVYFWFTFLAICVSLFMSAVEVTGTSTALPTIINELQGDDFVWVGSAYPLAATALLPASGGMAEIFGRQITMLAALFLFALGSALCGCAQNMSWLIAARTIQGAGGGALQALAGIIVSDLVPLRQRGIYNSFIGLTWAFAAAVGPLIGGGLAVRGQWRWFFYINLPISLLAAILVFVFLKLKTPPGTLKEKLARMDWIGNFIFIGGSTSTAIALTWGGITYPWTSAATLVPLILGLCGLVAFLLYEKYFAAHPIVPFYLLSNRTSLSGYLQTFLTPIVVISWTYYFIALWQSVDGFSPVHGAVNCLAMTFVLGPAMIITGASITITKTYRIQLWIGWTILIISMGAFTTVKFGTPISHPLAFSALVGLGGGVLYSAQYFPVLAPLPVSENAHALALFSFFRTFASVWAVTIGGTILQNQLVKRLPESFTSQFSGGAALAYAAIPLISGLEEPLRTQVREAFADSISDIWWVMIGIAGLGLLCSLPMKALPLHTQVDERWGIEADGSAHGIPPSGPGGPTVVTKDMHMEELERMLPHAD
ncbi:MFS general substrate transporter [Irpex rosettiformis]|uniref:MFS general substrate transporter n=1 Tax=Irpex rosettiformis TaxID=378272 RepID=A0ACB8TMS0_9APHY|nr:MFS general substrate transporter [Irpex rosettiformis]